MWKLGVRLLSFVLRRGLGLDWVCVCYCLLCLLCTLISFVWALLGSLRSDIDCPVFFFFSFRTFTSTLWSFLADRWLWLLDTWYLVYISVRKKIMLCGSNKSLA